MTWETKFAWNFWYKWRHDTTWRHDTNWRHDTKWRTSRLHVTASSARQLRISRHRMRCRAASGSVYKKTVMPRKCAVAAVDKQHVWIRCRTIKTSGKAVGCNLFAAYAARQSVTGHVTERTRRERAAVPSNCLALSLSLSPSLPRAYG